MSADIAVTMAGGGIGGLALGIALRRVGIEAAVIEHTSRIDDAPVDRNGRAPRSSSSSPTRASGTCRSGTS
jgi:2-polyprenyl-6-methoxyphenol hydroxylase-like FAD-dependent oxidoreductase